MPYYDVKGRVALPPIPIATFQKHLLAVFDRRSIDVQIPNERTVEFSPPFGKFRRGNLFLEISEGVVEFHLSGKYLIVQFQLDAAPLRGPTWGAAFIFSIAIFYFAFSSHSYDVLITLFMPLFAIIIYLVARDTLRRRFSKWLLAQGNKILTQQKN